MKLTPPIDQILLGLTSNHFRGDGLSLIGRCRSNIGVILENVWVYSHTLKGLDTKIKCC